MIVSGSIVVPEEQSHRNRILFAGRKLLEQVAVAHSVFGSAISYQHHARIKSPGDDVHAALGLEQIISYAPEHFLAADKRFNTAGVARWVSAVLACPYPPGFGQALVGAYCLVVAEFLFVQPSILVHSHMLPFKTS